MPTLEEQLASARTELSRIENELGGKIRRRGQLERSLRSIAKARTAETRQKLEEYRNLVHQIELLQEAATKSRGRIGNLQDRIKRRNK